MNLGNIIVLVMIGVAIVAAVGYMARHKNIGGCGGNCSACQAGCKTRK